MGPGSRRSRRYSLLWLLMAAVLLVSCGLVPPALVQAPAGPDAHSSDPQATPTLTPFAPATPTATPEGRQSADPTPIPTFDPAQPWGNFAAPAEPSAIEIPPPATPIEFDADVVNILLLGSDARPYEGGYRTDVIMIVSLDPSEGTATLISVPRDLYVYLPGFRMDRVNTADPRGGPQLAADTILYNFGIPIHHWARMNFAGFTSLVDSLGGLQVEVTGYLYDECGGTWYRYSPGTYSMDGFTALCYVRMRKNSSDFDRLRRQQEVLQAIFRKVLTLNGLTQAPELYRQFKDLVQTDVDLETIVRLLPLAARLSRDSSGINRLAIDPTMAISWRVPYSGAAVLLPERAKIEDMLRTSLGS